MADLHTHKIQPYSVTSGKTEETEISPDEEFNTKVALAERKFLEKFWKRQYPQAIGYLEEYQDSVYKQDKALASWHSHWIGYAYLLSGTKAAAERNFDRASKAKQALGCFNVRSDIAYVRPVTSGDTQGGRISIVLSERGNFNYGSFDEMNSRFSPLFAEKSTQFEEALFWLGRYLGFDSSRPDKNTKGRGPDVFWASPEVDILIECKDGKQETSFYSKKEVGQALNHNEWYSEEFPQSERHKKLMIVGPILPAHSTASPGEHIHIWTPSEISQLANRVSTLLYNAYTESNSATYASTLNKMLDEAGLTYMKLFKSLPDRPIKRK
ncbi:hypothetical protein B1222_23315 (plasmid) [Paenibacillus larvae subsp. pulvifaciens]|uniref:hypothetical protein n=1 Tax=Paenibacillus larvae TaxID=1464 RepID=UPI000990142C|nr:hypothetical protein [Paenibacillus larvae]AQT86971.1 hypothetical protein B1222_23315 [Paenibacillus larvae subsp. pulvifaciens]AQZ49300.1 hypothetical protein B5S25_22615 [Paenibacillus larvae subsp. pulvifaciens]